MPGTVTCLPEPCDCCGQRRRTLLAVFVNGRGWRQWCTACTEQEAIGEPRPYLGRYPITNYRPRAATPLLHLVTSATANIGPEGAPR